MVVSKYNYSHDKRNTLIMAEETPKINPKDATATRSILAYICVTAGMAYLFTITFLPISKDNIQFAQAGLGFVMGTIVAGVVGYYFGSSQSSADKNELLKKPSVDASTNTTTTEITQTDSPK
jgi:hypothetical protein